MRRRRLSVKIFRGRSCRLDLGLQTAREPWCKLVLSSVIPFYLKVSEFICLALAPKLFKNRLEKSQTSPTKGRSGKGVL